MFSLDIILMLAGAAILAGFLSGFLGIGGGLIYVPILQILFSRSGMEQDMLVRMSTATSHFMIFFATLPNARMQYKNGNIDLNAIALILPFLVIGSAVGAFLSTHLSGRTLITVFSVALFILGLNMLIGKNSALIKGRPGALLKALAGIIIGAFSSLIGIGAASVGVPVLTFFNFDIRKAIGSVVVMTLVISSFSSIFFFYRGYVQEVHIPYSLGYVNLLAALIMVPIAGFFVSFGGRLSKNTNQKLLRKIFAVFVLFISARPLINHFFG